MSNGEKGQMWNLVLGALIGHGYKNPRLLGGGAGGQQAGGGGSAKCCLWHTLERYGGVNVDGFKCCLCHFLQNTLDKLLGPESSLI